jgi:hypothetical protein
VANREALPKREVNMVRMKSALVFGSGKWEERGGEASHVGGGECGM